MRTEKRPLNLTALGVKGPMKGAASKSKNSGPRLRGAGTPSKARDGPGVVEPLILPGSVMAPGGGNNEWGVKPCWVCSMD